MADLIWLLLHHCFMAIMIWMMSLLTAIFYWSCDLASFLCFTTVWLEILFGWFYLTSITPLFYINYDFPDLFYCTTILLHFWFGMFLLLHDYFIASIILVISSIAPLFLLQLWFSWFLLLLHCLIAVAILLFSHIAPVLLQL